MLHRLAIAVTILTTFASLAAGHGELSRKIAIFTKRIEAAPKDAGLRIERGECHRLHKDFGLAAADYDAALRLDPTLDAVHLCRAMLYFDSARHAKALTSIDAYLERVPRHVHGLHHRARILTVLGRYREASDAYDHVIRVASPPTPDMYLERSAAVLATKGTECVERAVAGLDAGLERLGNLVVLQLRAIEIERDNGRVPHAVARVTSILNGTTRKERWLFRRAALLEKQEKPREAINDYRGTLEHVSRLPRHARNRRAFRRLAADARAALARLESR